jgi:hypothetical protein
MTARRRGVSPRHRPAHPAVGALPHWCRLGAALSLTAGSWSAAACGRKRSVDMSRAEEGEQRVPRRQPSTERPRESASHRRGGRSIREVAVMVGARGDGHTAVLLLPPVLRPLPARLRRGRSKGRKDSSPPMLATRVAGLAPVVIGGTPLPPVAGGSSSPSCVWVDRPCREDGERRDTGRRGAGVVRRVTEEAKRGARRAAAP